IPEKSKSAWSIEPVCKTEFNFRTKAPAGESFTDGAVGVSTIEMSAGKTETVAMPNARNIAVIFFKFIILTPIQNNPFKSDRNPYKYIKNALEFKAPLC
ncbi:hypothetical protein VPJ68_04515, partial [Parabacteroides distasonis]